MFSKMLLELFSTKIFMQKLNIVEKYTHAVV